MRGLVVLVLVVVGCGGEGEGASVDGDTAPDAAQSPDVVIDSDEGGMDADPGGPDLTDVPSAAVSGTVRIFGPPGGPLEGARIVVLEHPDLEATSDSDGRFEFTSVPAGDVTLVMLADGYPENQLGTHFVAGEDLEGLDFQAVSDAIFGFFAALADATPDPERCQVSTTVTRWFEGDLPVVHGEPGATAMITPPLPDDRGPVYFNESVLPTPELVETSVDGGVVWTNVPPGDYIIEAQKEGVAFTPVRIRCRPSVLVNAGPPYGLQALQVGSGY